MSEQQQTLLERLGDIPEQYIYLPLLILLVVPLINPIGLPIVIVDDTRAFYEAIDSLEPGDTVFFAYDALSMTWMEQGLGTTIVMKHLLQKEGVRIVGASSSDQGPIFWEEVIDDLGGLDSYGKEYGTDIVYLGYLTGTDTMMASLARDIEGTTSQDYYGTALSGLELMNNINSANDFKLMVCLSAGGSYAQWMDQWVGPYGIEEYVIPLAGVASDVWPRMEAGLIASMIAGSKGAAEYEILLGSPGRAASGMDAQTFGHIYVAFLVILANVSVLLTRGKQDG